MIKASDRVKCIRVLALSWDLTWPSGLFGTDGAPVQPVRVTVNHMIRPTGVRAAAKYEHVMEAELGVATMLTTGGRDAGAGGYRARGTSVAATCAEC